MNRFKVVFISLLVIIFVAFNSAPSEAKKYSVFPLKIKMLNHPVLYELPEYTNSIKRSSIKLKRWKAKKDDETTQLITFDGDIPQFKQSILDEESFQTKLIPYDTRVLISGSSRHAQAFEAIEKKDFDIAVYQLTMFLEDEEDPAQRANAYYCLGLVLSILDDRENCLKSLEAADKEYSELSEGDTSIGYLPNLAEAYSLNKEYGKAVNVWQKYLFSPRTVDTNARGSLSTRMNEYGVALANMGKFDQARPVFIAAIGLRQVGLKDLKSSIFGAFFSDQILKIDAEKAERLIQRIGMGSIIPGIKNGGDFGKVFKNLEPRSWKNTKESVIENLAAPVRNLAISLERTDEFMTAYPLHNFASDLYAASLGKKHKMYMISELERYRNFKAILGDYGCTNQMLATRFYHYRLKTELHRKNSKENKTKLVNPLAKRVDKIATDQFYDQLVEWVSSVYGPEHPLQTRYLLSKLFKHIYEDDFSYQLDCLDQALKVFERGFGKDSVYVCGALNAKAIVLAKAGQVKEAKKVLAKAIVNLDNAPDSYSRRKVLQTITFNSFALVENLAGKNKSAIKWAQKSLSITEQMKGTGGLRRKSNQYGFLAALFEDSKMFKDAEQALLAEQKVRVEIINSGSRSYLAKKEARERLEGQTYEKLIEFFERHKKTKKVEMYKQKSKALKEISSKKHKSDG